MKALVYNIKLLCIPTCQFFSVPDLIGGSKEFSFKMSPSWASLCPAVGTTGAEPEPPEQSGTVSATGGGARSAPPLVGELIQQRRQITTAAEMSTGPSSTPPPPPPAKTNRKKKGIRGDCFGVRVRMENLKEIKGEVIGNEAAGKWWRGWILMYISGASSDE